MIAWKAMCGCPHSSAGRGRDAADIPRDWLRRSATETEKHLLANDKLGHIEEDMRFHELIATATGNAELCRVLANVQSQIWMCRRKTYNLSSSTAPKAHGAIVAALEKGDRPAAQAAMRNHISLVRQRLIDYMEQH